MCANCAQLEILVFLNKVKRFLPEQALYNFFINITIFKLRLAFMVECKPIMCLNKKYKLQKRALQTNLNSPYLSPSKPFERYNALNIFDMHNKKRRHLCIKIILICFHIHSMDFSLSISQTTATILEIR